MGLRWLRIRVRARRPSPPSEAKNAAKAEDATIKVKEAETRSKEAAPKVKDAPAS